MIDSKIEIVDYSPEHKSRYIEINEAWIKKDYTLEDLDVQELHHLEKYILDEGGEIIIALANKKVVGTCALQNKGDGVFEMVKMAVDVKYRGKGIGRMLCEGIIEKARGINAKKIILFSNTRSATLAIDLYRKLGFREIPLGDTLWVRADIKMELILI